MVTLSVFTGMKVYSTDDKELIMEPSFKWAANPNIHVAVKAFGLRPTIQVSMIIIILYIDKKL